MDTTKSKSTLSLEQVLRSYNVLIVFLIVFVILMVLLIVKNVKGFNKTFGYEFFITGPILIFFAFLIKEIFAFKNNPQKSWLSMIPQSKETWFIPVIYLAIVLIGLLGFFMILNFVVIILFIVASIVIYKNSKDKDDNTLKTLPKALQDVFNLRTKYTIIFAIFVIVIMVLYFVNPWGIMTNYGGPVLFFTLFIGIVMVIMITVYQYFLANPSKLNGSNDIPSPFVFVSKGIYILAAFGISFGLIYGALKMMGVFDQDSSNSENWGNIIFNLIVFCAMLGIIYKLANAGGFLDKNPYYRLILNILFYIPCLLVTVLNNASKILGLRPSSSGAFTPPKPFEIKMLVLGLVLLGGYYLWFFLGKHYIQSKYLKQGGKQLINQPIRTNVLTSITSYQSLSGNDTYNYEYALSFWVYLDSFPPSSYDKVVSLLSYGETPSIKYSSIDNTLYITVKQKIDTTSVVDFIQEKEMEIKPDTLSKWKDTQEKISDAIENVKSMPFGNDVDADGHRIIYKHPDVQLQKWNHILLNYNGGTLDVFYNGKLVKSAIEVVPYINFDMLNIGSENGVSGNVANLMYFNKPLDILTINTLYTSLKDKNPPVIPENSQKIIPYK